MGEDRARIKRKRGVADLLITFELLRIPPPWRMRATTAFANILESQSMKLRCLGDRWFEKRVRASIRLSDHIAPGG